MDRKDMAGADYFNAIGRVQGGDYFITWNLGRIFYSVRGPIAGLAVVRRSGDWCRVTEHIGVELMALVPHRPHLYIV